VPLAANLVSIAIEITHRGEFDNNLDLQRPIYAFATLFLWVKVFYFLRIFRDIGHLVLMIFNVIYLMRFFFFVFFCFVIAFATAFYALTASNNGWSS